ncbi:MAG TPA: hypothetical protein VFB79_15995 [Candidatus Angelobacter sp.]|nr:hypothetical protein [Candidatus Angelobacter sp.]
MGDQGFNLAARLRGLTAEMRILERDLQAMDFSDFSALHDFRQVIDDLRMTAWTVSELQKAKEGRKEALAAFLAAERIRRFAQMIKDLSLDLEHQQVTWETAGIQTLFDSVNTLQSRLDRLIREHRANFRTLKDEKSK